MAGRLNATSPAIDQLPVGRPTGLGQGPYYTYSGERCITLKCLAVSSASVYLLLYFLLQCSIPLPGFSFFPPTLGGKDIG